MTKRDLVEKLAERVTNLSQKDAEMIVNTIFESMTEALAGGDRIEIRGFGSFLVKQRRAREGRRGAAGSGRARQRAGSAAASSAAMARRRAALIAPRLPTRPPGAPPRPPRRRRPGPDGLCR